MNNDIEKLVLPVSFECTPGWTWSPGIAQWQIGEANDGFGMSPPDVTVGNISVISGPIGLQQHSIVCFVELPSGDSIDPPCHEDTELIRSWFGNDVADCIKNQDNMVDGFKTLCVVDSKKLPNLTKLGRLAVINDMFVFDEMLVDIGRSESTKIRPEVIEALSLANELGWTELIDTKS
ncbi:hypothetical protein KDA00_01810 [Candidatus Saccharibacteria bacterium]|nr:hypothetical protein [Candidatus Saccharibacteria bacterium]